MTKQRPSFDTLCKYFKTCAANSYQDIDNYIAHAKRIVEVAKDNDIKIIDELFDVIENKKEKNPVQFIMDKINNCVNASDIAKGSQSTYKSKFKAFIKCVIGFYNANVWFSVGKEDNDLLVCKLVAQNALFASKHVVQLVKEGKLGTKNNKDNAYASWDNCDHIRAINTKKNVPVKDINNKDCRADDNCYANRFIKQAVVESFKRKYGYDMLMPTYLNLTNYEACHVWDKPDDSRYYASIMNLVLLPSALAQLSDDNEAVKKLLRYEAWKRFGFYPDGENKPICPNNYNEIVWRDVYGDLRGQP